MIAEKLQQLGARERRVLWIAGLCVLALAADRLAVRPVTSALSRMQVDVESAEQQLALNLGVLQQADPVCAEYLKIEPTLDRADSAAQAIDTLKAQLDDLAVKSGLRIGSMEQKEPKDAGVCSIYAVEIGSFEARVPELFRFLHGISMSPGLLRVSKMALDSDAKTQIVKGSMLITRSIVKAAPAG